MLFGFRFFMWDYSWDFFWLIGDALQGVGDFGVENVGVSGRGCDVAVIERLLHDFHIARLAQEASRRRMAKVMKAEVADPGPLGEALPFGFPAFVCNRVASAPDAIVARAVGDEGEHEFRVMASQRL